MKRAVAAYTNFLASKVCTTAWTAVLDYRLSIRDRVQLLAVRLFKSSIQLLLRGLTLLIGTQALQPLHRVAEWLNARYEAIGSGLAGVRGSLTDYVGLVLSMGSLLAVLVLKPIVGVVLGALVSALLASLAAIDSLFNYRGVLDGLLALALSLALTGVEALGRAANVGGVLDDVLCTVWAMFDDYLRYRELRAASARGEAGAKTKAEEKSRATAIHVPKVYDHELKKEPEKEEDNKAEPARQRSGSEEVPEPTQ